MSRKKNKTVDELRAAEAKALRERDEKNALIKELHNRSARLPAGSATPTSTSVVEN